MAESCKTLLCRQTSRPPYGGGICVTCVFASAARLFSARHIPMPRSPAKIREPYCSESLGV